ncbi:hypothetical protein DdX_12995 [Ditylenchus destructor]|uniref:Uncharacterized protein n=1 Tax=Ditylenchus destructor TaxID=166010 RepID=A0AAD4MXD4_9BILA|nr:hypothetical protein DdX_12995 [Ditylenchus destructor]
MIVDKGNGIQEEMMVALSVQNAIHSNLDLNTTQRYMNGEASVYVKNVVNDPLSYSPNSNAEGITKMLTKIILQAVEVSPQSNGLNQINLLNDFLSAVQVLWH